MAGGGGGDGGWWDAEAVADEEGELCIGEEGALRDTVAEKKGGGSAGGACADTGDGVRGGAGSDAEGKAVAGYSVGKDCLAMAVGEEADVGDGG